MNKKPETKSAVRVSVCFRTKGKNHSLTEDDRKKIEEFTNIAIQRAKARGIYPTNR